MRFDDRLMTVLNQPASDRHDAAVRWRQLVDLVARAGPNSASPVVAQALESIRAEAANVDEPLRAAAARAVAALPLPLGLLECFAADRLSVAAPVLAAATLEPAQWRALIDGVGEETRRFILTLHPDLGGPATDLTDTLVEAAPAPTDATSAAPAAMSATLSEVVAKIERRRRGRQAQRAARADSPAVPAGAPTSFRWECGPSGEIAWIDGAPRGALIGRSIARVQESDGDRLDDDVVRAFAMRAPFREGALTLAGDGVVAGDWRISGVPAFEPSDGRFAGYRGIASRDVPVSAPDQSAEYLGDPDSLRELVHEIKTPLNAIMGFAEIIDGQFLGPADRRYRERAAEIVAQARLLLGAIDDLDFAAKVHPQRRDARARADLAELIQRAAPSLRSLASERQVELEIAATQRIALAAIEPELADRLIFRLCSAMIETAEVGEGLRLSIDQSGDQARVSISRPAVLRGLADAQLFDLGRLSDGAASAAAFSARLIRGLARIGGGDLVTTPAGLTLVFART